MVEYLQFRKSIGIIAIYFGTGHNSKTRVIVAMSYIDS